MYLSNNAKKALAARLAALVPAVILSRELVQKHGWKGSMSPRNTFQAYKDHPVLSVVYFGGLLAAEYWTFQEVKAIREARPFGDLKSVKDFLDRVEVAEASVYCQEMHQDGFTCDSLLTDKGVCPISFQHLAEKDLSDDPDMSADEQERYNAILKEATDRLKRYGVETIVVDNPKVVTFEGEDDDFGQILPVDMPAKVDTPDYDDVPFPEGSTELPIKFCEAEFAYDDDKCGYALNQDGTCPNERHHGSGNVSQVRPQDTSELSR